MPTGGGVVVVGNFPTGIDVEIFLGGGEDIVVDDDLDFF